VLASCGDGAGLAAAVEWLEQKQILLGQLACLCSSKMTKLADEGRAVEVVLPGFAKALTVSHSVFEQDVMWVRHWIEERGGLSSLHHSQLHFTLSPSEHLNVFQCFHFDQPGIKGMAGRMVELTRSEDRSFCLLGDCKA